jgi:hypothetical protein
MNIQIADMIYMRGRFAQEQVLFFETNNDLSRFNWKNEINTPSGARGTELTMDNANITAVIKTVNGQEVFAYPCGDAIPEIFLEQVLAQMLSDSIDEVIVDIIDSEGKIIPTLISALPDQSVLPGKTNVFSIRLLDDRGFSELRTLDNKNQILYRQLQHDNMTVERTNADELIKQFPQQADYIRQRNNLMNEKQL